MPGVWLWNVTVHLTGGLTVGSSKGPRHGQGGVQGGVGRLESQDHAAAAQGGLPGNEHRGRRLTRIEQPAHRSVPVIEHWRTEARPFSPPSRYDNVPKIQTEGAEISCATGLRSQRARRGVGLCAGDDTQRRGVGGTLKHRNCTPLSACDCCPARLNRHSAWPRETPWSAPIPSLSTQPRLLCAYCGQSL